jgi:hypothetical protein
VSEWDVNTNSLTVKSNSYYRPLCSDMASWRPWTSSNRSS